MDSKVDKKMNETIEETKVVHEERSILWCKIIMLCKSEESKIDIIRICTKGSCKAYKNYIIIKGNCNECCITMMCTNKAWTFEESKGKKKLQTKVDSINLLQG